MWLSTASKANSAWALGCKTERQNVRVMDMENCIFFFMITMPQILILMAHKTDPKGNQRTWEIWPREPVHAEDSRAAHSGNSKSGDEG